MSLRPASRFSQMYRSGTWTRSGALSVVSASSESAIPEVGVVAGKKVGNAVRRNRAKRRLREAASMVDLRPNKAYVLVASAEVPDVAFPQLVEWLDKAITKVAKEA